MPISTIWNRESQDAAASISWPSPGAFAPDTTSGSRACNAQERREADPCFDRGDRNAKEQAMTTHTTGTRKEWLAARMDLLKAEKELTHRSDAVARQRQALPWVKVEKDYSFDTDGGRVSLKDLFRGRSQLLTYHFMFGPDYKSGCPSCSAIADGFNGIATHLAHHDVMLWAVSRAPLAKLQGYKQRMGWTFPWASSFGGDFNVDFNVRFTEEQQRAGGIEYNYRREAPWQAKPGDEGPVEFAASAGT